MHTSLMALLLWDYIINVLSTWAWSWAHGPRAHGPWWAYIQLPSNECGKCVPLTRVLQMRAVACNYFFMRAVVNEMSHASPSQ